MLQNCLFTYSLAKYSCFNKWSFFPSIFQSTAVLTSGHSFPSIFHSLLFSSTDFRYPYLVLYPCAWELQEVQWIISSNMVGRLSKYRFPFFHKIHRGRSIQISSEKFTVQWSLCQLLFMSLSGMCTEFGIQNLGYLGSLYIWEICWM